jgi:hypothetical protein
MINEKKMALSWKKFRKRIIMPFSFCITWDETILLIKQKKSERE